MKVVKTWAIIHFHEKDAHIEVSMNYETKKFYLTHSSNDQNVTFNDDISVCFDRAKCVNAALKYIKSELNL